METNDILIVLFDGHLGNGFIYIWFLSYWYFTMLIYFYVSRIIAVAFKLFKESQLNP